MARKTTAKKKADAQSKRRMKNPLTGGDPNTFSQGTDSEGNPKDLWQPVNAQSEKNLDDPYVKRTQKRARQRSREYAESGAGRTFEHPIYGTQDIDSPEWSMAGYGLPGYDMGKIPVPPTVNQGSAINESHEVDPDLPYFRRAEDLSGVEYGKAKEVLKNRGVSPESMTKNLVDTYQRAHTLAMAMYQTHPAGTGFYQDEQAENPTKPEELLRDLSGDISRSDAFRSGSGIASPRAIAASATSDTSPNAKVVHNYADPSKPPTYPNHGGARAATEHVLAGGEPEDAPKAPGVYHTNIKKAAKKVKVLLHTETGAGELFDPASSPKTAAFYAAQLRPSTPDSMTVGDVHAQHRVAPHLSTRDSHVFDIVGPDGLPYHETNADGSRKARPMSHTFEAEDVGPDGLPNPHMARQRLRHYGLGAGYRYVPRMSAKKNAWGEVVTDSGGTPKLVPTKTGTPTEEILGKGGYPTYALLDRAHREAAHQLGFTPSPSHAQASNHIQEVAWEDERLRRPDIDVTHDTSFPGWRSRLGAGSYQSWAEQDDPVGMKSYDPEQAQKNIDEMWTKKP